MKNSIRFACAAMMLALGTAGYAEDYVFLRGKTELITEEAKGLLASAPDAACKYYFGLIYASGTNLLGRAESSSTSQKMQRYISLAEKDYEAYTKVSEAMDRANATGGDVVAVGNRQRVVKNGERKRTNRRINAEKLRDKELEAAVKRWQNFATQLLHEKR